MIGFFIYSNKMMKKSLVFLGLFIISLFGFVLAQDSTIGDISVEFCNGENITKSLSMILDSGKEGEICMEFSNYSDNDVNIDYGFVDGVITADQYKSKACKNEGDIDIFGQYVTQDLDNITIPSKTKVTQKAYVKFPGGFTGMVNGCLTYFVSNAKDSTNIDSAMFDVLVRKASFIDVLVGGKLTRSLKLSDTEKAINSYFDEENEVLILEVTFDNEGTVNENVLMNVEVSNIFGYHSSVSGEVIKVLSDGNSVLRMEIKNLPWYKMFFNVDLSISSTPNFDFDPDSIPDDMKETIYIDAQTNVFVFPWMLIYILGGAIVLIVVIKVLAKHLKFQ